MSNNKASEAEKLAAQRAKIDAVDESIHSLLMQRAGVIDELIRIKGASTTKGAAFRPGREASMMAILAERHKGSIPFSMIGHIWREIISTFTHMQAAYCVHVALEGADANALRDMARFQFGFTVPMQTHQSVSAAFAAAANDVNAIIVVNADTGTPWWDQLKKAGLLAMAKLPIHDLPFEAPDCYCLTPPLSDPTPFDVRLYTGTLKSNARLALLPAGMIHGHHVLEDGTVSVMLGLRDGQKAPTDLLDITAIGGYFDPVLEAAQG